MTTNNQQPTTNRQQTTDNRQQTTVKNQQLIRNLLFVFMMFFIVNSYSQSKPDEINVTPNGILDKVFDQSGKEYILSDLLINKSGATLINCSTTSYFNLYFEVGSGMENSGDPIHMARRAVVCKVFEDLSNFINSPLSTNGNRVNIWVRNINNVFAAPNGILGLASAFYNLPTSTSIGGIADNEIWKTIHTGTDSYLNSTVPLTVLGGSNNQSGLFFHGIVTFNFNTNNTPAINFNANLTTTTIPSGEFDLYSAVLHEVTHALGFASLINQDGNSIFGPNFRYYSRYDRFLKTNDSTQFLLTSTGCSTMYDYAFNTALNTSILHPNPTPPCANTTTCGDAIQFVGLTNTVPVYTPKCFNSISSLSHFEDTHFPTCNTTDTTFGNDNYFLMCNAGNSGMMRRFLKPEERNALCDIGYSVNTTYGSTAVVNSFVNYGGTTCNGISVAGINDGINNPGSYTFIGNSGTNINISAILSNDTNATGFECLQDLTATIASPTTLSATSGTTTTSINFNSTLAGLHLLRYVPTNVTQRGNITYVYVFVQPIVLVPFCNPTQTACNLVSNGDFEQNNGNPPINAGSFANNEFEKACGWFRVGAGSPDYYYENAGVIPVDVPCNWTGFQADNVFGNKGYVGIGNYFHSETSFGTDIIGVNLATPLQSNTTYQLRLDVSLSDFWTNRIGTIQAFITNANPATILGNFIPITYPTLNIPITEVVSGTNRGILCTNLTTSNNTNTWDTITFTFTTGENTDGLQFLYIGTGFSRIPTIMGTMPPTNVSGCSGIPSSSVNGNYYIDNVSLVATGGAILNLPESICTNQSLSDLSQFINGVRPDGTFSGTGVTTIAGISGFNATIAGVGTHTINYTYNNNLGCPVTISDTIVVTNTSNGITFDAINDNFDTMPIDGASGGVTTSVYINDFYDGLESSSASLPNVTFSLVSPVSIPGASINSMGLITVPSGTAPNTYTLTYRLNVIGNCNISDTATVIILVVLGATPNLVAGIRANNTVKLIGIQNTNKSIISGSFTTYNNISCNNIARLNTNLTFDPVFNTSGPTPSNYPPNDMVIQADNKIIVVGAFTGFSGGSNGSGIARLLADGGIDPDFNVSGVGTAKKTGYTNNSAHACAIQTNDNKILIGGDFYYYNDVQRLGIARLNPNGSLDGDFIPTELNTYYRSVVTSIFVQPDGKIILLGIFSSPVAGATVKNIIRLMPNGSIDHGFFAGDTVNSIAYRELSTSIISPLVKIAYQPIDGKIIVVGAFTKYSGLNVKSIIRLYPNGQFDFTFNSTTGVDRVINEVILEPNTNKVIIGGEFTTFGTAPVKKLIRLKTNGSLDSSFSIGSGTTDSSGSGFSYNFVKVLKQQPDGKIIVGGKFTTFNGLSATNITRILGDTGVQAKNSTIEYQSEPEINTNFESNVIVYPNPSKDIFNIDLTQVEQKFNGITIYNLLGEKVYFSSILPRENNAINLSHLANGCYFARLTNDTETTIIKLIKN